MKINLMSFNNYSSTITTNDTQKNSAKANLAFHSASLQAADAVILKIVTSEKSSLLRNIRAFEGILGGSDSVAKAHLSLKIAEETRRLASIVYGESSTYENAIVDGTTGKGFQSKRLSQYMAMPFEDLAKTELGKKLLMQIKIYGNTDSIAKQTAEHLSAIENALKGLEGFTGLGNENSGLTVKFNNTKAAGDALREAAVSFRALCAYFYETAGREQQRINERVMAKSLAVPPSKLEANVHWHPVGSGEAAKKHLNKGEQRSIRPTRPVDRQLAAKQLTKGRPQVPAPVELDLAKTYYTQAALLASV